MSLQKYLTCSRCLLGGLRERVGGEGPNCFRGNEERIGLWGFKLVILTTITLCDCLRYCDTQWVPFKETTNSLEERIFRDVLHRA